VTRHAARFVLAIDRNITGVVAPLAATTPAAAPVTWAHSRTPTFVLVVHRGFLIVRSLIFFGHCHLRLNNE
jgi:hypothetical protein